MANQGIAMARDALLLFGTHDHYTTNTINDSELSLLTSWTKKGKN